MNQAAISNDGIPYERWFESWMPHFLFNSLQMLLDKQNMTQELGPLLPMWETWMKLSLWLQAGLALAVAASWGVNQ